MRFLAALSITASLLFYVGATTDFTEAARTLGQADFGMILGATLTFPFLLIALDAASLRYLLRRAGYDISNREMLGIRGAAQLGTIASYALALAMMTAAVARSGRRAWLSVAGVFVLVGFIDAAATSALVLFMLLGQADLLPETVLTVLLISGGVGIAMLPIVWLVIRRRGLPRPLADLLDRHEVLTAVERLGLRELAVMAVFRAGLRFLGAVEFFVYALALHFTASLGAVVVFDAATSVVASLPFTVADLGSTQIMMRWLWEPYAPAGYAAVPAVDAFSTASVAIYALQKLIIGLACLPWFLKRYSRLAAAA